MGMTKGEMEMLIAGMGEMFREYLASLDDSVQPVYAMDTSDRSNAEHVFRDLLAWLERDYHGGGI